MSTSVPRVIAALIAVAFALLACASDTGAQWTYAPVAAESSAPVTTAQPTGEATPVDTAAPVETASSETPAVTAGPAESGAPGPSGSGEPRVIELQADAALRFVDASGQPLTDIPVTPGETVIFRIDNTAGFDHNFWIGTDAELSVPSAETDTGLPQWTTGVQELTWVVPADLTDLKFGCTVPGHYFTMQGTFSVAQGGAEPASTDAGESTAAPAEGAAAGDGEARVIELEADAALRFLQNGEQIRELVVTPGENVIFRINNTAGFAHNFYIGTDEELKVPSAVTDTGISDWETGVQELAWTVPDDITGLRFACTFPGHYVMMQGDFVVSQ